MEDLTNGQTVVNKIKKRVVDPVGSAFLSPVGPSSSNENKIQIQQQAKANAVVRVLNIRLINSKPLLTSLLHTKSPSLGLQLRTTMVLSFDCFVVPSYVKLSVNLILFQIRSTVLLFTDIPYILHSFAMWSFFLFSILIKSSALLFSYCHLLKWQVMALF